MVSILDNIDYSIKNTLSGGYQNNRTNHVLIFGGYDKVREILCMSKLLLRSIPFQIILIQVGLYQGMKVFGRIHTQVVHSKLCSITRVATKVHIILRNFVVLTGMHDNIELV
jgi:hypothetical protein